ncbi:MAG: DUF721 domain-containing protein [Burkholderiales bacterium]|nr:DUF721 domain-containing protein [Burkholderiales bacterium]
MSRILAGDEQIAAWHQRMQQESQLTAAVRRMLPRALADRVRVAEAGAQTLKLAVPAGAIAAVVRQRSPDLLAGLRREGLHFTQIEVRVQVAVNIPASGKAPEQHGNRVDSAALRELAATLPPGPLREAVLRLVRRAG